jgi:hypothetical protein
LDFSTSKTELQNLFSSGLWWPPPVILAIQEADIRNIMVQSQSREILHETRKHKTLSSNPVLPTPPKLFSYTFPASGILL